MIAAAALNESVVRTPVVAPGVLNPEPVRAVHTPNFPGLLRRLGASLLATTYQAGRLVMVRGEGDHLNTHFRGFQARMGLALQGDRLAIGNEMHVRVFRNVRAVTARLDPSAGHDACFLPRCCHLTGDVQVHEMAWGGALVEVPEPSRSGRRTFPENK
jgi:uncharacterized protein (TIGR03032 family)